MIKTQEEVERFIEEVHRRLRESTKNIYIVLKHTVEDKTHNFMNEYNLTDEMICEELLKLNITNYSKTEQDIDDRFRGGFWFFGQMFEVPDTRESLEIYIKIKLKKRVICMSFHPKEWKINYPYL